MMRVNEFICLMQLGRLFDKRDTFLAGYRQLFETGVDARTIFYDCLCISDKNVSIEGSRDFTRNYPQRARSQRLDWQKKVLAGNTVRSMVVSNIIGMTCLW
jgi:hypothetical protein